MMASLSWSEQRTRAAGISVVGHAVRLESNRLLCVGVALEYGLPALPDLRLQLGYAYTLDGNNVGQAATATMGVTYRFDFDGRRSQ